MRVDTGGGGHSGGKNNPIARTHKNFVLSTVSLASRDQDGGPLNSRYHGKIGDCEQSRKKRNSSFLIAL